jgi:uncharacterized protein
MKHKITGDEARQIALSAQGLGARPASLSRRHVMQMVGQIGVVQIDAVSVLARTHYLPAFSRLGAYPRTWLEDAAWGRDRKLLEYWAHEASLIPLASQPLLRWRMEDARNGVGVWKNVAKFRAERRDLLDAAMAQIAARGPLAASELELGAKGAGGWWGWSDAKRAAECLFWGGELTSIARRPSFERVFAPTERALPTSIVNLPTPGRDAAYRHLVQIAARAMGVATARDLRDYFRLGVAETRAAITELVETGALIPVAVEGWADAAFADAAPKQRRLADGHALLSPFDNSIWFRDRARRLFDVNVKLEIYTPAEKRVHGYYVLPFLENGLITARVDLKADRKRGELIVQASHADAEVTPDTPERLARELHLMARWLGLDAVSVKRRGGLAPRLAAAVRQVQN